ncbi:ATP-dependent DNA helicase (plasmid) [Citricoccus nitrophenolicus]
MITATATKTSTSSGNVAERRCHLPKGITGASEDILAEAIRLLTGLPDAAPRPGQAALSRAAAKAAAGGGHTAHIAPTGSGKSFGLLAPAFAAALAGRRTAISTESLSLMEQVVTKDAPVVAAAVRNLFGVEPPTVAVHKGFSNHLCNMAVEETATDLWSTPKSQELFRSGPVTIPRRDAVRLVEWARGLDDDEPADAQSAPDGTPDGAWRLVSVGSGECVGKSCQFAATCRPLAARVKAADADIVVTNHSLLAMQAAAGIPTVNGGAIGEFQTIMVDEAHALPSWVRNQGSATISPSQIASIARAAGQALGDPSVTQDGSHIAAALQVALSEVELNREGVAEVTDKDDPFRGTGALLDDWTGRLSARLKEGKDGAKAMQVRRASGRLEPLKAAVGTLMRIHPGTARWYAEMDTATGSTELTVNCAPVGTGGLLAANLWGMGKTGPDGGDGEGDPEQDSEDKPEPVGVVAVSATLQKSFLREAGLTCRVETHPSPFADAMSRSAVLIPKLSDAETETVFPRDRFSVDGHREYAARVAAQLVIANKGSALVLAASAASGKFYAEYLRRELLHTLPGLKVTSQWDGVPAARLVANWRDDVSGVLVGTRSLMTGVDAKGDSCTLVIIDRPSRSAANPVDDARAAATGLEKWPAADVVYAGDAALLLAQAAGRLIRSASDSGMVALLEPRMLASAPTTYKPPVRRLYMDAFTGYGKVLVDPDQAAEWCRDASSRRAH